MNKIQRTTGTIIKDKLEIDGTTVAIIHEKENRVSPMHGYYPPHPYAKRVKAWAKRHDYEAPLY